MVIRVQILANKLIKVLREHARELRILLLVYVILVLVSIFVYKTNAYFWFVGTGSIYYYNAISLSKGIYADLNSHFPPLYSISLMPAVRSVDFNFRNVTIINSLMLSTLIFWIYGIAQYLLERKAALTAAILSAFLPLHLYFSRTLFSENLFLPLLFLTMFVVLLPSKHILKDIVFSVLLAMLYLSRYIVLSILPAFLLVWFLYAYRHKLSSETIFLRLVMILSVVGLLYLPWIITVLQNGEPIGNAFGFQIASRPEPEQQTIIRLGFAMLLTSFISILYLWDKLFYLLLALLVAFRNIWRDISDLDSPNQWRQLLSTENLFWILFASLFTGFSLAIVRHHWNAGYNFPYFTNFQIRYLSYLAPLAIIVFSYVITKLEWRKEKRLAMVSLLLFVFFIFASYLIVFDSNFQNFIDIEIFSRYQLRTLTNQGLFLFQNFGASWVLIAISSILIVLVWSRRRFVFASGFMIVSSAVIIFLAYLSLADLQLGYAAIGKVDEYLDANVDNESNTLLYFGLEGRDWEKSKIRSQRHKIWSYLGQFGELSYARHGYESDMETYLRDFGELASNEVFVLTEDLGELFICEEFNEAIEFSYLRKDYWIAHCE